MRATQRLKRGFTLVELMIVVAIIGVLAALAIYGVNKYLTNAKTAEAREVLGRASGDAAARFSEPKMAKGLMADGDTVQFTNRLCNSAPPVPANLTQVAASKYQSTPQDWVVAGSPISHLEGWQCLKFTIEVPQIYQVEYVNPGNPVGDASGTTPAGTIFDVFARGDLDGDTVPSVFRRQGQIVDDGGAIGVKLSPSVEETDPEE